MPVEETVLGLMAEGGVTGVFAGVSVTRVLAEEVTGSRCARLLSQIVYYSFFARGIAIFSERTRVET